jgi:predicted secreted protein
MTTQLITLSEYRKNISAYTKQATEKDICFIITSHGKPVWEYKPLTQGDIKITTKYSQDFIDELAEMERDYEAGNYVELNTRKEVDAYFAKFL